MAGELRAAAAPESEPLAVLPSATAALRVVPPPAGNALRGVFGASLRRRVAVRC